MQDNDKKVSIDQLKMLDFATLFGVMIYSFDEEDKRINLANLHPIESIVLLASSVLLPKGMDEEYWSAAMLSIVDALYYRTLGSGSSRPIIFPEWDPEDHFNEDCHQFVDAFFALYAWNLAFDEKSDIDFAEYFGPIFTFSGIALEGIARGYHQVDDNVKKIANDFLKSYKLNSKATDKDADFNQKLDYIGQIAKQYLEIKA